MSFVEDAPRRFYKQATVAEQGDAFAVLLDGRTLRTPKKAALAVPKRALAELIAGEWNAQDVAILAHSMPLTRLVNVALDFAPDARVEMRETIIKFGETDTLGHRALDPAPLVKREDAAWDPLLEWAEQELGVRYVKILGILPQTQSPAALAALAEALKPLDDFRLTGVAHAAGRARSAVIALAMQRGALSAAKAFAAAAVEETYQLDAWGEDAEARERLDNMRAEFEALERFFSALA